MVPSVHQLSPIMDGQGTANVQLKQNECQCIWKPKCLEYVSDFNRFKFIYLYIFFSVERFYFNKMFLEWCCKLRLNILFICTLIFVLIFLNVKWDGKIRSAPMHWNNVLTYECNFKMQPLPTSSYFFLYRETGGMQRNPSYSLSVVLYIERACEISTKCQRKVYFSVHLVYVCNKDFPLQVSLYYVAVLMEKVTDETSCPLTKCISLAWR